MPYTLEEKKRAINRLHRISGQTQALEQAITTEADCGAVLQQLTAIRGAINGLMASLLEDHLRESLGDPNASTEQRAVALQDLATLVRSYFR